MLSQRIQVRVRRRGYATDSVYNTLSTSCEATQLHQIEDYSDVRHKSWCIHCGIAIAEASTINRDHVPTKSLLCTPYPDNLPCIHICTKCNESFSLDEEYFSVFLGCVLAGSTDPSKQADPRIERALSRNSALRYQIESSKLEQCTLGDERSISWRPDLQRINNVILKNARGHAYFELGEPIFDHPQRVWCASLQRLTASERFYFERFEWDGTFPEIGSRLFTRYLSGKDLVEGWVLVQENRYRYFVNHTDTTVVRTVISEYLATEVCWNHL